MSENALFVNVADVVDPNDPQKRTFRQINAARKHLYPIHTLVELESGARLFVVAHNRDCDMTPLYTLAADDHEYISGGTIPWGMSRGHAEEGMKLISLLEPARRDEDE